MNPVEPYKPREVEYLKEATFQGWRLKVYGISTGSEPVLIELAETGLNSILPNLPQPALTEDRYGVGFAIIHEK